MSIVLEFGQSVMYHAEKNLPSEITLYRNRFNVLGIHNQLCGSYYVHEYPPAFTLFLIVRQAVGGYRQLHNHRVRM